MARYVPLITKGVSGQQGPPGAPALPGGYPTNGIPFWDDFHGITTGTTIATSKWLQTAIAGTNTIGTAAGSAGQSILVLGTGASSGDGVILDLNGRTTVTAGSLGAPTALPGLSVVQWRCNFGNQTAVRAGFGLVSSVATFGVPTGTNWLTDPATTLAGIESLIFHVDTAAASGALRCFYRDSGGTADETITLRAAPVSGTFYTISAVINPTAATITIYLDGVADATVIDCSGWSGGNVRPTFGIQTSAAGGKIFQSDYYYQVVGQTARR